MPTQRQLTSFECIVGLIFMKGEREILHSFKALMTSFLTGIFYDSYPFGYEIG